MVKRSPETRTPKIRIMNYESEEERSVLGSDVQQSIASARTHTLSANEEEELPLLRQTDAYGIAATVQESGDRENEETSAISQNYELQDAEEALPESEIQAVAMIQWQRQQQRQSADERNFLDPSFSLRARARDEEECADCVPASETRGIAMSYQGHLQQEEGGRMEANHQQPRMGLAEPADESPPRADHTHTNPEAVQRTWQDILTGSRERRTAILTHETTRANDHWGDECFEKMGDHIRIYVQNVNGIRLDKRGGQFDSVCQVQKEVQADIFLGQEHNLDS